MDLELILWWCLFAAGLMMLAGLLPYARGTTLMGPWQWTVISWLGLGIVELLTWGQANESAAKWRFMAAVGSYCPAMSLFGAKRPQDRGWHFVVATLWLILAWPALQAWILRPLAPWSAPVAWRILLAALLVMSVSNYVPTRHGVAAIMAGLGQSLLIFGGRASSDHLVFAWESRVVPWALLAIALALALYRAVAERRGVTLRGWNRVWRDFRNAYGCVWALRVAERVNQVARQDHVPLRLNWHGFVDDQRSDALVDPGHDAGGLAVTLHGILRRFVSDDWLAARV
jgi:hypothetical protein